VDASESTRQKANAMLRSLVPMDTIELEGLLSKVIDSATIVCVQLFRGNGVICSPDFRCAFPRAAVRQFGPSRCSMIRKYESREG
jgi:hypothetical protein